MELSIIIPAYNVNTYIKRCLDSVVSQMHPDLSVVIIDDGSTDDTLSICKEYEKQYAFIDVIHQENKGLSAARNLGMDVSKGDYIMFLDSDDWIEDKCIDRFIRIINKHNPDIIVGKANTVNDLGEKTSKIHYYISEGLYSINEYLHLLKEKMEYTPCAPFTVYKRSIIANNSIKFKEGITHEDVLWTPTVLLHTNTVYYADFYFYCNYIRSGSITRSGNLLRSGKDSLIVCNEMIKLIDSSELEPELQAIKDEVVRTYLRAVVMLSKSMYEDMEISGDKLMSYSYFSRTRKKVQLYTLSPRLYILASKIGSKIGINRK